MIENAFEQNYLPELQHGYLVLNVTIQILQT